MYIFVAPQYDGLFDTDVQDLECCINKAMYSARSLTPLKGIYSEGITEPRGLLNHDFRCQLNLLLDTVLISR